MPNRLGIATGTARAGNVGGKTLIFFQLHHIHAHRFDDFFSRRRWCPEPLPHCTKASATAGIWKSGDAAPARWPESMPSMKTPDELLAVLRAVHKRSWPRRAADLCAAEKAGGAFAGPCFCTGTSTSLARGPAGWRSPAAVDRTRPYSTLIHSPHVDAAQCRPCMRDGRAGEPGDQGCGFRWWGCRTTRPPWPHTTMANSAAHSAISASCGVAAEIHHVARWWTRQLAVHHGHHQNAQEVKDGRH